VVCPKRKQFSINRKTNKQTNKIQVFHGVVHTNEPDPNYKEGVKMSLFNSAAFSGVTLVFSLVLPFLIRPPVGVKAVWLLTTVLSAVCYGLFSLVENVLPAFAINAGIALNFCVFNSVPFALIPLFSGSGSKNSGLYVGLFNSSSFVAQVKQRKKNQNIF
jgi:predicted secreted protein